MHRNASCLVSKHINEHPANLVYGGKVEQIACQLFGYTLALILIYCCFARCDL